MVMTWSLLPDTAEALGTIHVAGEDMQCLVPHPAVVICVQHQPVVRGLLPHCNTSSTDSAVKA